MRRKLLATMVAALFFSSACFGTFPAIRAIYNWNKGVSSNKWVQEIVFLVLSIVPVYAIGGFIDVIILNTMEFWTGKTTHIGSKDVQLPDGRVATVTRTEDGTVTVRVGEELFTMVQTESGMQLLNGAGEVLAVSSLNADGSIAVSAKGESVVIGAEGVAAIEANPAQASALIPAHATCGQ